MKLNISNKEMVKSIISWEKSLRVVVLLRRSLLDSLATEPSTASKSLIEAIHQELWGEADPYEDPTHALDDRQAKYIATDIGAGRCFVCFDHLVEADSERAHLQHLALNQPSVISVRLKGANAEGTLQGVLNHSEPLLQNHVNRRIAKLYNSNGYDVRPPYLTMLLGPPGSGIPSPE